MVAVDGGDDPRAARGAARQLDREVDGLAAAGSEHRAGEISGRDLGELRGQFGLRREQSRKFPLSRRSIAAWAAATTRGLRRPTLNEPAEVKQSRYLVPSTSHTHGPDRSRLDDVEPGGLHDPDLLRVDERRELLERVLLGGGIGHECEPDIPAAGVVVHRPTIPPAPPVPIGVRRQPDWNRGSRGYRRPMDNDPAAGMSGSRSCPTPPPKSTPVATY